MGDLKLTYQVDGGDLLQAGEASSKMKMTLKKLDLPPEVIRKDGGHVEVVVGMDSITIRLVDQGPGIPDVDKAMEEGFTTAGDVARDLGFGAGMGLPNMKRYSDEMEIDTTVGVGTTVTMRINIA